MPGMVALLLAVLVAGCSGVSNTAGSAYEILEASRPEAATTIMMDLGIGLTEVELRFPEGYSKSRRWPACLVLRSKGSPLLPDMHRAAAQKGFILAEVRLAQQAPELEGLAEFADSLLHTLREEYAADPRRFTLYGRGQDADLASQLICMRSHAFSGQVLIDGGLAPADCRPVKPIPTIIMYSQADAAGQVASFWANKNGCEPMPTISLKDDVERERYQCPQPLSAVQRYLVRGAVGSNERFAVFPAAWTVFEFLARQTDQ